MGNKVIATKWRTARNSVGFVAIETGLGGWKAYTGCASFGCETLDAQTIADTGCKLSKSEAIAFFPFLNPDECENK